MKLIFTIVVVVFLLESLSDSLVDTQRGAKNIPYYEDFFTYFINEAPFSQGNYDKNFTENVPWADANLLSQSLDFYRRNYVSFAIMQVNSLVYSIAIKTMSSVVEITKSFEDVPKAYERLLTSFIYFRLLFEAGPELLNPKSDAAKALQFIRRRHRSAAYLAENRSLGFLETLRDNSLREFPKQMDIVPDKETRELVSALREDLAIIDTSEAPKDIGKWDWTKPVSQFDLGVVHFFFYGIIVFNPQGYGIYSLTEEEIKAYRHFWAVVGRQIGIEDRFNGALHLPLHDHARFYRNIIVANLKNGEEINFRQMGNLMEGVYRNFLVPTAARFKCWLFYFLKSPLPEFEGRNLMKLMNKEDIVCLQYVGIVSGPINLSFTYKLMTRLGLESWLRQEIERVGIKYEF